MTYMNKVELVGYVNTGPVMQGMPNGGEVVNLILITKERGVIERHRLVFWNNLAREAMSLIKMGDDLEIEGKLKTREWTSSHGERRIATEVIVISAKLAREP